MVNIKEKLNELKKSKSKTKLIWIAVVIIIALLLYRFKSVFIAATVNGQPISRLAVIQELEKQGGKSILDSLITNALVFQEAKKQNVTVTNDEITAEVSKIETNIKAQGQDLDQILTTQGMTRNDLTDQIKFNLLLQKLGGQGIDVTDKEAEDSFKEGQTAGVYAKTVKFADVKTQIIDQLKQQKSKDKITAWLTDLKSKAKINHFVSY